MKKFFVMCAALLFTANCLYGRKHAYIEDIAGSEFSAERLSAITPLADGESYAMISKDGKKVVKYSFKTGKQAAVLFDADNTIGEKVKKVENFIMSPDGTRMLSDDMEKARKPVHKMAFWGTPCIRSPRSRRGFCRPVSVILPSLQDSAEAAKNVFIRPPIFC